MVVQTKAKVKISYKAKVGAPFPQSKAQEVGETLGKLQEKNKGILTADVIVKAAHFKNSVLYPYFDWDESVASDKWLLHQARMLINHVEVIYEHQKVINHFPAYINVLNTNEDKDKEPSRGYVDSITVGNKEFMRKQALKEALNQLTHWKDKYAWLKELSEFAKEIDKLRMKYKV